MSDFAIMVNGSPMEVYTGETIADVLEDYARDAGYQDYAAMLEHFNEKDEIVCLQIVCRLATNQRTADM